MIKKNFETGELTLSKKLKLFRFGELVFQSNKFSMELLYLHRDGARPVINQFHLKRGTYLSPQRLNYLLNKYNIDKKILETMMLQYIACAGESYADLDYLPDNMFDASFTNDVASQILSNFNHYDKKLNRMYVIEEKLCEGSDNDFSAVLVRSRIEANLSNKNSHLRQLKEKRKHYLELEEQGKQQEEQNNK